MTTAVSAPLRPDRQAPPGGPGWGKDGPGRERRAGAGLAPWGVVAIWGVLLTALAAAGAGFGNSALVLEVSGSAAGFVLLLAVAVWLDRRLRPRRGCLRQPVRVGGVFMLAVAAALAWAGLAFGAWLVMIAAAPLAAAIGLEIAARGGAGRGGARRRQGRQAGRRRAARPGARAARPGAVAQPRPVSAGRPHPARRPWQPGAGRRGGRSPGQPRPAIRPGGRAGYAGRSARTRASTAVRSPSGVCTGRSACSALRMARPPSSAVTSAGV